MPYESVDHLQKALTKDVFVYAHHSKKAAGRALGTIVEIMTFYLLESWGLASSISIENKIPEFGNPEITHNVEYSLHPIFEQTSIEIVNDGKSLTAHRLLKLLTSQGHFGEFSKLNNTLLSHDGILRNGCTIAEDNDSFLVALIETIDEDLFVISVAQQSKSPYAIFECKRVGVEEGTKKGPQTIEKAKQGAYVARTVSSLQKVRLENGELYGIIYQNGEIMRSVPYHKLLQEVINSDDPRLLRDFVLTVGVVSNHGNWFTANDQNKELKVLSQSYDWLIFLTDQGITEFIEEVILAPQPAYQDISDAFHVSYKPNKMKNQFTKVKMNIQAHLQLLNYFDAEKERIRDWFNIISPGAGSLEQLKDEIQILQDKDWRSILA